MLDLDLVFQEDMIEELEIDVVLDEVNESSVIDLIQEAAEDSNRVDIFNDTIY